MATKKELVQAQGFARRRLLTAFTSGIPDGKELEPAKPMRAVIAGIALSVLVVLGGLGFGLLSPSLPEGWQNNHLIVVKDSGSRYISAEGILYPVLNTASARLAIPAGSFQSVTVKSKQLDGIERGPAIGIVGAPDELPPSERLVGAPWTACLVANGSATAAVATYLAAGEPVASAAEATALVHVEDEPGVDWLIASGRRYPVDSAAVSGVTRALALTSQPSLAVPAAWLNLFAPGAKLEPFAFADAGGAVAVPVRAGGRDLVIGSALTISSGGQRQAYVVTDKSELAQLTPVAAAMYEFGLAANPALAPVEVAASEVAALKNSTELPYPADWPAEVGDLLDASTSACAITTGEGEPGRATVLAAAPAERDLTPGVAVTRGHGALALPTDSAAGDPSYPYLIDQSGTAYGLPKSAGTVLAQLGYEPQDATPVPRAWIALFPPGPALDPAQAVLAVDPAAPSPGPAAPAADPAADPATAAADADISGECAGGDLIAPVPPAYRLVQGPAAARLASGRGIRVAVVDSGVAVGGAHFDDAVQDGWDFRHQGGAPPDEEVDRPPEGQVDSPVGKVDLVGHGTAVAGLIAARPVQGSGLVGIAPEATIIPIRVFVSESEEAAAVGHAPTAGNLANGIAAAAAMGAEIINVSMSTEEDSPALREAVAEAQAAGALIVAAAGNLADLTQDSSGVTQGRDGSVRQVRYPAAYPGVVGVAAVATEDGSAGAGALGGPQVDLAAPGTSIVSTYLNGGDCLLNGTDTASSSFATAYVSGAAALVASLWPDAGPDYWAHRLAATAVRPRGAYADESLGWGVLQVHDALTASLDASVPGPVAPVEPSSSASGESGPTTGGGAQPAFRSSGEQPLSSQSRRIILPAAVLAVTAILATLMLKVRRSRR
ncbi:MAG: type VII secretion protein EccB [Bifidobacteriaceae bacterium]|jgi:type VII secretion protein EccB|nr:type VII secretion protein EccB [Bifidobacteriaceae bacterium]